jgi:hypothetical protein
MPINDAAEKKLSGRHLVISSIIVCLLIRLIAWFNTAIISRDSIIYIELARDWISGHYLKALAHPYHPLYSFLIALASKVTGFSLEHSAVGLSIVVSALTIPALETLFKRYGNPIILFLGLLFFSVSPFLVRYAADILTEPLYLFFVAWGAAFFVKAMAEDGRRGGYFFLAGASVGFAYLTRPEGIVTGIAGAIWILSFYKNISLRKIISSLLVLVLGGIIIGMPYILYLHKDTGTWTLTRKKKVETLVSEMAGRSIVQNKATSPYLKDLPKGIDKKRAEFLKNRKKWQWEQADRIRQVLGEPNKPRFKPNETLLGFILTFLLSLGELLIGFVKGMFFPIGIWVVFRFIGLKKYPWNRIDRFILIFSVLYWVMLGLLLSGYGYVSRRHYSAVAMFWFVWAAMGFIYICETLPGVFKQRYLNTKVVGMCLLVPLLGISVVKGTKPFRAKKVGRRIVGAWILQRKPANKRCVILTSMVRIGYYAGCRAVFLQTIQEKDVNALRRHEIAYVILQKREMEASPALKKLLEEFGYREVYHYTNRVGHQDLHVFSYTGKG